MKIMAEGDYFNIGMIVSCTTCHGQKIQGEVVAFDYSSKTLVLKSPSVSGKPNTHDVRLLNLTMISDVKVVKEATEPPAQMTKLSSAKLHHRLKSTLDEKLTRVNYVGVGVTPQAQRLFHHITKTINEVRWEGQDIIVMDQVTVVAPYGVDNCKGKGDSNKALGHVKKLVEKFHRDSESRELSQSPVSSSS